MNIRNFDLNLLVILNDLNRTQNVSQTAINLGLSQPAVSHALNRLREGLEDELFIRTKRVLIPTERAKELAPVVSETINSLSENLFEKKQWNPATSQKNFNLAGTSYDASILLPELVGRLKKEAPFITYNFKGINIDKYLQRMIDGEVDLSFAGNLKRINYFNVETLGEWGFCLISGANSKKYKKRITMEQYLEGEHILYSPTEVEGSEVDRLLAKKGRSRKICIETSYLEAIPQLVCARDYLAILPQFYAHSVKERFPIRLHEIPFEVKKFKHQMVWHKSKNNVEEHQWLRDFIRSQYLKILKA